MNHTLRAAIKLGRYGFRQRRNLGNVHFRNLHWVCYGTGQCNNSISARLIPPGKEKLYPPARFRGASEDLVLQNSLPNCRTTRCCTNGTPGHDARRGDAAGNVFCDPLNSEARFWRLDDRALRKLRVRSVTGADLTASSLAQCPIYGDGRDKSGRGHGTAAGLPAIEEPSKASSVEEYRRTSTSSPTWPRCIDGAIFLGVSICPGNRRVRTAAAE